MDIIVGESKIQNMRSGLHLIGRVARYTSPDQGGGVWCDY